MSEVPDVLQALVDDLKTKFKIRGDDYVKKAMEMKMRGPERPERPDGLQIAQPISGTWPLYPWWNLFVIGPIQIPGSPHIGPFRPSKIITHGNPAYMITCVWRNPMGINWDHSTPSACQIMNGWEFQINFEVMNLTSVSAGPDLTPVKRTFPNAPDCIQCYVSEMTNFPEPVQGRPDLYNLYATIDIVGHAEQPFAGFATWVYDPDTEPRWWFFPEKLPQLQYEQPVQFMIYKR